jgi:Flp pilus assembly protein CpaB
MRITIPRQRAALGGFLVALAAILAFLAANGAHSSASATVVVARRAIAPGTRLSETDLEVRTLPGADQFASHGFRSVDLLVDSSLIAPVASGELIQQSAVRSGSTGVEPGFSFPIDREHALDGDLRSGDSVDVVATFGTGLDATTIVLATSVRISSVEDSASSSASGSGRLVVNATFSSTDQMLQVAHAAQVASLTLIRTAGASTPRERSIITSPQAPIFPTDSPATGVVLR